MTLRERLETLIETAIDMLDQIDGDCDLEEDGTLEPSLDPGCMGTPDGILWLCNDLEHSAGTEVARHVR